MSALELLKQAQNRGLHLVSPGVGRLRVSGPSQAIEELEPALAVHKLEILALLSEYPEMTADHAVRAAEQILRDIAPRKPRRQRRQRQP